VFEAHDRRRMQHVALKVLREPRPGREFHLKREFRALVDLRHPNLVRMHELGRQGDLTFITMELVDGVDFVRYVRGRDEQAPDWTRLRSALWQLVSAVQALHDGGKLHCDLKPSNVLVDRDGRVVVLDFGLLHEIRTHLCAPASTFAGTPGFMAPELSRGHQALPASDWYSVGAILYQAITGESPLAARSHAAQLAAAPADLAGLALDLMDEAPDQRPGGVGVAARLGSRTRPAQAASVDASFGLVGRVAEFRRLTDYLERARAGHPTRVVVDGPSGIGKTALLTAFLDHAVQQGAVALAGKCHERDTVPYKALDTIVDELSRYLTQLSAHELAEFLPADLPALLQLFPVLARVVSVRDLARPKSSERLDPVQVRERALHALKELLRRIGERVTLVLFIDDLQWGDEDSARLLMRLMAPPDPPRLLLVAAHRSVEMGMGPAVDLLLAGASPGDRAHTEHILLSALSRDASCELVARLLAAWDAPPEVRDALAAESAGNPLFATELALSWRARDEVPAHAGASLSLAGLLRARVARLPAAAAELLELTVVASRPPRVEVLRQALSGGAAALFDAVDQLKLERLVHGHSKESSDFVACCHDRIREAVDAQMDPSRRRQLHRQLADAIQAVTPDEPDVLLVHLLGAGDTSPAGDCAARAGDAAARVLAFDRAAQFFRMALELLSESRALELGVQRKLADVLAAAGRCNEAAGVYLELERRTLEAPQRAELLRCAGVQAFAGGDQATGVAAFERLFVMLGLRWPRDRRPGVVESAVNVVRAARLTLWALRRAEQRARPDASARLDALFAASESLIRYDQSRSLRIALPFMALAVRDGAPALRAHACVLLGNAWLVYSGASPVTFRLFERAGELAERAGDPHALAATSASLSLAQMMAGRFEQGEVLAERGERLTHGIPAARITHENAAQLRISGLLWQGKLRAADRALTSLLAQARERGHLFGNEHSARIAAEDEMEAQRRGDPAWRALRAEPLLRHADSVTDAERRWRWESWIDLLGALHRGDLTRATELAQRLDRDRLWARVAPIQRLYAQGHLALANAEAQPDPALCTVAARAAGQLERLKLPYAAGFAGLLRAGIAIFARDAATAHRALARAAEQFHASGMLLHAHCARRALGHAKGNADGHVLVAQAEAFMREQSIVNVERWTACYVPAFERLLRL